MWSLCDCSLNMSLYSLRGLKVGMESFSFWAFKNQGDLNKNTVIIFILTRMSEAPYATCFQSTAERIWLWNFTKPLQDLLQLTHLNNNQSFPSTLLISNPLDFLYLGAFVAPPPLFFFNCFISYTELEQLVWKHLSDTSLQHPHLSTCWNTAWQPQAGLQ